MFNIRLERLNDNQIKEMFPEFENFNSFKRITKIIYSYDKSSNRYLYLDKDHIQVEYNPTEYLAECLMHGNVMESIVKYDNMPIKYITVGNGF